MTKNSKEEVIDNFANTYQNEFLSKRTLEILARAFLDKYKNFMIENAPQKKEVDRNMDGSNQIAFKNGYSQAIDDFIEVIKNN